MGGLADDPVPRSVVDPECEALERCAMSEPAGDLASCFSLSRDGLDPGRAHCVGRLSRLCRFGSATDFGDLSGFSGASVPFLAGRFEEGELGSVTSSRLPVWTPKERLVALPRRTALTYRTLGLTSVRAACMGSSGARGRGFFFCAAVYGDELRGCDAAAGAPGPASNFCTRDATRSPLPLGLEPAASLESGSSC